MVIGECNSNWWPLIGIIAPRWWLGTNCRQAFRPKQCWKHFHSKSPTFSSSENELQKIWDLIMCVLSFLSASFEICTGLMMVFCISLRNVCSQLRIVKRRRWRRQRFDTFLECWLAPTPSYLLLSCNFLFAQNCHFVNGSWMLNIQEQNHCYHHSIHHHHHLPMNWTSKQSFAEIYPVVGDVVRRRK